MARLLTRALRIGGHEVTLLSRLRSFAREGDAAQQLALAEQGEAEVAHLLAEHPTAPVDYLLTYHVYHKAPDYIGPALRRAWRVPYLIAEASHAGKQAHGPWASGHAAALQAIRAADVVLALTAVDEAGLTGLVDPPAELHRLRPFIDTRPFAPVAGDPLAARAALSGVRGLDPDVPWLITVAMLRADAKAESYDLLIDTLRHVLDLPWRWLVIGDGAARARIEARAHAELPGRVLFLGQQPAETIPAFLRAADLFPWASVREAYGLALIEAQAAGCPVLAMQEGGVAEVIDDGVSGYLVPARAVPALAARLRTLLLDPARRRALRPQACDHARSRHDIAQAIATLDAALIRAAAIFAARPNLCAA